MPQVEVFSTAFFPSIAYMAQLRAADNFIIDTHESYLKQTYRNRCTILSANGLLDIFVPVQKGRSPQTPTHSLRIAYQQEWQKRMWRSITSAYRSSPFFEYYADELIVFFEQKPETLLQLNTQILQTLMPMLGMPQSEITYSHEFIPYNSPAHINQRHLTAKNPPQPTIINPYQQVFSDKFEFQPNLSVLDLLFCEGPNAINFL